MSGLVEGISICGPAAGHHRRVRLSAGATAIAEEAGQTDSLGAPAYVPSEPWRDPTVAEEGILFRPDGLLEDHSGVAVVKVPRPVLDAFDPLGLDSAASVEELQALTLHPQYARALESALAFAATLRRAGTPLVADGIKANPPGLPTVTFDDVRRKHIGLHLDNWDRRPLEERDRCSNRLTINLGSEDRYFLFINIPAVRFPELVAIEPRWSFAIVDAFLRSHREYPVVRIAVAPGEAYVAPTENLIHDGSTLGMMQWDVNLSIRGHFALERCLQGRR